MAREQNCLQCGKCCEKWGWGQNGIPQDLVPWIANSRADILQHVSIRLADGRWMNGTELSASDLPAISRIRYWVGPGGRMLGYCPFFLKGDDGKAWCRIHDTKPVVCSGFAPWDDIWHDYALDCPACRDTVP